MRSLGLAGFIQIESGSDKGDVEGVKYDRIYVVLINAMKELQAEIEKQGQEIDSQ